MKSKIRRVVLIIILILLIATFAVSTFIWARNIFRSKKENNANRELAKTVEDARRDLETMEPTVESGNEEVKPKQPVFSDSGILYQYDALWQRNHEMAGWLEIKGTNIAYPVMYTPDYVEKYLRRAFDGSYAISGTLFLGDGWDPDGNYGLIYGHNMDDGAMFGHLLDYYSDAETAKKYSKIEFDTLTETREYELVAAFYSRIYGDYEEGVFRYYDYVGLPNEEYFDQYFASVRKEAVYDTGIDVRWGDKILVLSTCSYHTTNGRFVVVARYRPPEMQ